MSWFWLLLAVLAGAAGLRYRQRLGRSEPRLSDRQIAQIETSGWVDADEPLDMEEIKEEEEEFWSEEWDPPEEW